VTDQHLALHPEFFSSVQDRPLHLVFKLKKPQIKLCGLKH